MNLLSAVPAGTYVIAVSGGVDSIALLHMLSQQNDIKLVVAHFDHGIRHNSSEDAKFVRTLTQKYSLEYEEERAELGPNASEEQARKARYAFLRKITKKYEARAVITAHHQDDLIETSIINLLRGTGRHGLTSLKSLPDTIRPLLHVPKQQLIVYANQNSLSWHEDETNADTKYLRNKVRIDIMSKMNETVRADWLSILGTAAKINEKLDREIQNILRRGLHKGQPVLNRHWFIMLPHQIAKEVLLAVLRQSSAHDIDRKTVERLTIQIKTLPNGKVLQAGGVKIMLTKRSARFVNS